MGKHEERYEALKLQNQVCFPLYACSKELIRQYGPFLKECGLTDRELDRIADRLLE